MILDDYEIKQERNREENGEEEEWDVAIDAVPGIGRTYASRLRAESIGTVGELRAVFEGRCARSESRFEDEMRRIGLTRANTISKCLEVVRGRGTRQPRSHSLRSRVL